MEEIILSSTVTIAAGTEASFTDKHIRIKTGCQIVCNGTLTLKGCEVHSRESGYSGHICVTGNGQINAVGCTFVNYQHSKEQFFIELAEMSAARFDECKFEGCTQYIKFAGNLVMNNCRLQNCLFNAVATGWNASKAECRLENIHIKNDAISSAVRSAINNVYDFNRRVINIEAKKCIIYKIAIAEGVEFSQEIMKYREKHYVESDYVYTNGVIDGLTMENTSMSVCSMLLVKNGRFNRCISPVRTKDDHPEFSPAVIDCEFVECTEVILTDHRTKIEDCTFSRCYGNLIEQRRFSECGGICVDNCRFLDCTNETKEFNRQFRYSVTSGAALLFFRGSEQSKCSSVRNCLIEGMVLNEGYFVATETLYKTPGHIVSVSDCKFWNCYTNRNDYEIFKRSAHYCGMFGAERNNPAIRVQNCIGLDEIRNDFRDDFGECAFDEDDFDE